MRPKVTAISKVAGSARRPGAITASTCGMPRISTIEKGISTTSSAACAWRAKVAAASRPLPCSSLANSGTKAAEKAPSANRRRKKFGSLNATKKASAIAPEPSTADSTISRMNPTTRLSSVKPPTVAMARPRLMESPPQYCHHHVAYSLSVAAGDVMAGLNRYHGRSSKGAGFLLSAPPAGELQECLAVLGHQLLVVGDDAVQLVGRQHVFQIGESLRCALFDDVEHDVDALAPVALDVARHWRQAALLVALQRGLRIAAGHEFPGDRLAVDDRLRRPIRADRIHRMCRIAQQRDAAMAPAREGIAVDHREFQDRMRRFDDARHVEPVEFPVLEARQEIGELARPVPVLARQHRAIAHMQVADPVDQRLALFGVRTADRIADEFLRVMACLHHGGAIEERLADGDAAPHQDALPLGGTFVGMELCAHGGVDAVGADQDIGFGGLDGPAVAVREARMDLVALLLEASDTPAELDPLAAQHGAGCVE